jgi:catechol 2,3-dioxygenase-like lactoylglutathione lyase family enzyme
VLNRVEPWRVQAVLNRVEPWSIALVCAALLAAAPAIRGQQQSAPRPRITGIDHVAFRVTDVATARKFYTGTLGLRAMPRTGGGVSFAAGRQHIAIEPGLPAGQDDRLSHLAFETTDIKALAAHLAARGIETTQPADRCERSAIVVTDPDGHAIEFVEVKWPRLAAAAPATALSSRLLHAGLVIRSEDAAHKFYRDVLGFLEIWRGGRPEGTTSWVNMRVPDGTDYLEYMLYSQAPTRTQLGSAHHACLRVADIQTAWETAARRTPDKRLGPPNVGVNGKWQLNLFDPDGTRVELMEPFRTR